MEVAIAHRPAIPEGESIRALAQRYIALAARPSSRWSAFSGKYTLAIIQASNLYKKEILMARIEHLERAFPSSPKIPPKYIVKVHKGKSFNSEAFVATYAAQAFVLAVIADRQYKWKNENTFVIEDDTQVECEQGLEDIMEHKLTRTEAEWELPEPYASRAHFLATGVRHEPVTPNPILTPKQTRAVEKRLAGDTEAPKRSAPPPRADRKGLTTIQDICTSLSIEPRIARAILRKKNEPKPSEGWAWDKKTAATVEAMIRKELKK